MARPIEAKALPKFRVWLRYDDGVEGEVDLSDLAGRGVFKAWNDAAFFNSVRLASHGAIEWGADIDICPDAMYLQLTGKSPEEVFPSIRSVPTDAWNLPFLRHRDQDVLCRSCAAAFPR